MKRYDLNLAVGMKIHVLTSTLFDGYVLERGACGVVMGIDATEVEVLVDSIYTFDRSKPQQDVSVKLTKSDLEELLNMKGLEFDDSTLPNIA